MAEDSDGSGRLDRVEALLSQMAERQRKHEQRIQEHDEWIARIERLHEQALEREKSVVGAIRELIDRIPPSVTQIAGINIISTFPNVLCFSRL